MSLNFWKLLSGRMLSNIGDCFYNVSLIWLIYHITGNTFYTGLTGFLVLLPMMLQFLVGPLIERYQKKKLLIATEVGQIFTVITAFILYTTIWPSVWALMFLTPVVAILSMFSNPAEMTLIPEFVEEDKYSLANSMMNVTYQALMIVFTSLVGVLLAWYNPLYLYAFSLVFNVCAALCFLALRVQKKEKKEGEKKPLPVIFTDYRRALIDGIRIFRKSFIIKFLPATIVANLVFGMLSAVLPAYAMSRGGGQWFGFYQSAQTLGILIGAALAPLMKNRPLGRLTIGWSLLSCMFWLVSFLTENNYLSVILYSASMLFIGLTNVLFITAMQTAVPRAHLAQMYTLMTSFGGCAMPLGSLAGGQIGYMWGVRPIFISIALSFLLISASWLAQRMLREMPPAGKLGRGDYAIYPPAAETANR